MMFRSATGSQMAAPGQGRSNPNTVTPYLTHLVTHHGQLTVTPPQNASRTRKGGKKNPDKPRPERRRDGDEPRFNTAVPSNLRGPARRANNASSRSGRVPVPPPNMPRDSMIPDYPPPTFQEALMTPPFIPLPVAEPPVEPPPPDNTGGEEIPNTSSPPPDDTRGLSPAAEPTQPPTLTVQTALSPSTSPPSSPLSQQTIDPQSGSSGSDESSGNSSSLEIVNHHNATEGWEADRQRGVPLEARIHSELHRLRIAESTTNLASSIHTRPSTPSNLSSLAHECSHCGSPKPASNTRRQLPQQSSPEVTEDEPDSWSPPASPKSTKKGWKKLFAPIVIHDSKSIPESPLSPMPKSPTSASAFTMLQNAWTSTVTLTSSAGGSPSKSAGSSPPSSAKRRESYGVRRLFGSKGKERDLCPPDESEEEPWEVVSRASVLYAEEQDKKGSPRQKASAELRRDCEWPSEPTASHISQRSKLGNTSPYTSTPPFLNRSVRHPAFSGSTLTLPFNHSAMSLAQSAAGPSSLYSPVSESGSPKRAKRPPPPPPPPRRKAMSTTNKPMTSVVHLPLLDTDNISSPLEERQIGSPVRPMSIATTPTMPRPSPSLPTLRPSSREGIEQTITLPNSAPTSRLPSPFGASTATLVPRTEPSAVALDASGMPSVPMIRYPSPTAHVTAQPAMLTDDNASAMSFPMDSSPPGTPTTPGHHYPGRPLPHPPHQPSPLRRTALTVPLPEVSLSHEEPHGPDLDISASRGDDYDDLPLAGEFAGPAAAPDPFLLDADTLKVPPAGRVTVQRRRTARDGRVRTKRTLHGAPVDKCGICLSPFLDAEVACLATRCPHAFHEYCLKRWVVQGKRTCPLCRAEV